MVSKPCKLHERKVIRLARREVGKEREEETMGSRDVASRRDRPLDPWYLFSVTAIPRGGREALEKLEVWFPLDLPSARAKNRGEKGKKKRISRRKRRVGVRSLKLWIPTGKRGRQNREREREKKEGRNLKIKHTWFIAQGEERRNAARRKWVVPREEKVEKEQIAQKEYENGERAK